MNAWKPSWPGSRRTLAVTRRGRSGGGCNEKRSLTVDRRNLTAQPLNSCGKSGGKEQRASASIRIGLSEQRSANTAISTGLTKSEPRG